MNILIFSPSTRMIWIDKRALNPAYQLIAYLAASLSKNKDYTVYTVEKSFRPVMKVKPYKGQKIDLVISIGALYVLSDTTKKIKLDPNFPRHKRMLDIAKTVWVVFSKWCPPHINLCVDVNAWSDELTKLFGRRPDHYISEQEMGWQTFLYHYCNRVYKSTSLKDMGDGFFYAGSAKNRVDDFLRLTEGLSMTKVVAGSGWEKALGGRNKYVLLGFQKFFPNVITRYLTSRWSVVFQTYEGNASGWITGRLFMNIGCRVVGFVDREYDKKCKYVPKNSILRVKDAEEIERRMRGFSYERLLAEQGKIIDPRWEDFDLSYVMPFERKVSKLINQIL